MKRGAALRPSKTPLAFVQPRRRRVLARKSHAVLVRQQHERRGDGVVFELEHGALKGFPKALQAPGRIVIDTGHNLPGKPFLVVHETPL